jgi:hypothetical protein
MGCAMICDAKQFYFRCNFKFFAIFPSNLRDDFKYVVL